MLPYEACLNSFCIVELKLDEMLFVKEQLVFNWCFYKHDVVKTEITLGLERVILGGFCIFFLVVCF